MAVFGQPIWIFSLGLVRPTGPLVAISTAADQGCRRSALHMIQRKLLLHFLGYQGDESRPRYDWLPEKVLIVTTPAAGALKKTVGAVQCLLASHILPPTSGKKNTIGTHANCDSAIFWNKISQKMLRALHLLGTAWGERVKRTCQRRFCRNILYSPLLEESNCVISY